LRLCAVFFFAQELQTPLIGFDPVEFAIGRVQLLLQFDLPVRGFHRVGRPDLFERLGRLLQRRFCGLALPGEPRSFAIEIICFRHPRPSEISFVMPASGFPCAP
jgi:hypothetical protein